MSVRASGVTPLKTRQPPHVRLRAALREIAHDVVREPGRWSPCVEARARILLDILHHQAGRAGTRSGAVLVAQFERHLASQLLKDMRLDDLERVRLRGAERSGA